MKYPLETIRHSFAHILAMAVLELWPETKLGIGPAIENGFYYDFDFTFNADNQQESAMNRIDLPKIEARMKELIAKDLKFIKKEISVEEAKKIFKNQPYKLELIEELLTANHQLPTIYETNGFVDLCKGPHIVSTKDLKSAAFKLTKIAGAYWRGSEKNPMLTRIYGLAFESPKQLDEYLKLLEESEKRDHRKIGKELELFTFSDLVGPGLPIWTPKGAIIRDELEKLGKEIEKKWGYQRIITPHIAKEELFKISGHLPYYKEDMYPGMELDDATYYLKAMNCPITMAFVSQKLYSYRDLPLRFAEFGTVYRYERSGVLSGLLRVRGFTQNDAHIFCAEEQLEEEFIQVMKLHEYYYRDVFGIKNYYVRLSLRDKTKKDKFGGNDEIWEKAEGIIRAAIKKSGVPFEETIGEASFYGPKADFQIKSVTGREETNSTNQIDFIMPARFGLKYIGSDAKEHPLAVIHRAPLGSHERFIGFLIEHYAGAFPFWLAPIQIVILTVNDKKQNMKYAASIIKQLKNEKRGESRSKNNVYLTGDCPREFRVYFDARNESIGKKIREAELQKIPFILIIGDKEVKSKKVSVRERGKGDIGALKLDKLISKLLLLLSRHIGHSYVT